MSAAAQQQVPTQQAAAPTLPAVIASAPPMPADVTMRLYTYNPRLRARMSRAQDQLLEELTGEENLTARMLSANGAPLAFVVPDGGYNTVSFSVGAVELDPQRGEDDELELIVTLGEPKINSYSLNGSLRTGEEITLTIPWRYASWVELAPDHLRAAVTARFSAS